MNTVTSHSAPIYSREKSFHLIFFAVGIICFLLSLPALISIPEEIARNNQDIWFVLVFPVFGLLMCFSGIRQKKKHFKLGLTPLILSPEKGQAGGQLGGTITVPSLIQHQHAKLTLSCMRINKSSSGSSSSSTSIIWQQETLPYTKLTANAAELAFCFDLPDSVPLSSNPNGKTGKIYWQVCLSLADDNPELTRHWIIPVVAGSAQSSVYIPKIHREQYQQTIKQQAKISSDQQIEMTTSDNHYEFLSKHGRNTGMSYGAIGYGSGFSMNGLVLLYFAMHGKQALWFFGSGSLSVGVLLFVIGLYLHGRELECKLTRETLFTCRSVFGRVWKSYFVNLTDIYELELKKTMSSQDKGKLTLYTAVYAWAKSANGQSQYIKLIEGIEGKEAGASMLSKVSEALKQLGHSDFKTLNKV